MTSGVKTNPQACDGNKDSKGSGNLQAPAGTPQKRKKKEAAKGTASQQKLQIVHGRTIGYANPTKEIEINENVLMPNDSINGWSIPIPNSFCYDTLGDLL